MNLSDLHDYIDRALRHGHFPAFLVGVFVGISPILFRLWRLRGVRFERPQKDLRDKLSAAERERDLLQEKALEQQGTIRTLREQKLQTSDACDRATTELFEARERIRRLEKSRRRLARLVEGYNSQLNDVTESDGKIWMKPVEGGVVPFLPLGLRRTPILCLANLKGGVGKTTLTANLGVTLAASGLRVLLIDLDHQSSLSNLCLLPAEKDEVRASGRYIDRFFAEGGDFDALNRCVTPLETPAGTGRMYLAAADEPLDEVENQLMTRWHSGLLGEDARFRLRAALHTPALRDRFDVVLIDCPPRLTTACVNALAASDYVLIPVQLDDTSAESVPRLLTWLKHFRLNGCFDLNVLGIVANRAFPRERMIARERSVWNTLRHRSEEAWGDPVRLFDEAIREHTSIAGRFAALDPRHHARYQRLVAQIRKEIPHARLEPPAVPPLLGAPAGGPRG